MKFKVGDRVRVVGDDSYGIPRDYWNEIKGNAYRVTTADECYKLDDKSCYSYCDEMFEPAPFGKADLKTGMRVRYRDGRERIVLKNDDEMVFTSLDGFYTNEHDYTEDLICTGAIDESLDIMEVLKPKALHKALEQGCELISVWKREENPIEVTIAEIAELKGVSPERIRIKEAE